MISKNSIMFDSGFNIPHSRPTLGDDEVRRVSEVIRSGHIAKGKVTREFEDAFARRMGMKYAVSTNSGTAALHLALLALGVGEGDRVILPSYVCSALLNAVRYVRATPVLAEIDPATYNLHPSDVKKRITVNTCAIIVPHLFGKAADMDGFKNLGVPIIEDCAQALGASYQNTWVGTFGEIAVFSFYATKMMTTGEGGMVVSNDAAIMERVCALREYDETDSDQVRYNYKMTDMQAAMGLAQLDRLAEFIDARRRIAACYNQAFDAIMFSIPKHDPGHIYYRYVLGLNSPCVPWIEYARNQGIGCACPIFRPLHHYLGETGFGITDDAWNTSLSIPIYPSLSESEMTRIIECILNIHRRISKGVPE